MGIFVWCRDENEALSHSVVSYLGLPSRGRYESSRGVLIYRVYKTASILPATLYIHVLVRNCSILIQLSLIFITRGQINTTQSLGRIMISQTEEKPLSEPFMAKLNDAYMRCQALMCWRFCRQKSPLDKQSRPLFLVGCNYSWMHNFNSGVIKHHYIPQSYMDTITNPCHKLEGGAADISVPFY